MQLNQFNLYSINTGYKSDNNLDFVDQCRQDLVNMDEYKEVKDYITSKFGKIEGEGWFDYPELNKEVYIVVDDQKVEFCALKNENQYFGKGWKVIREYNN